MSDPVPAIGISLSYNLGESGNLVFQTHVPQIADARFVNDTLDKLRAAATRQEAFFAVEKQEFALQNEKRLFELAAADFARIEQQYEEEKQKWYGRGRKGEYQLDERQSKHREQMLENLKRLKLTIETATERLEVLKKKAA